MKKGQRAISLILISTLITSIMTSLILFVPAEAVVLWSQSNIVDYFNGAQTESIKRFSSSGWQSINIIRADLTKSVKLDVLLPAKAGTVRRVVELVKDHNAIAATNGGFFSLSAGFDAIGPIVRNGELVSFNGDFNPTSDSMVSIFEDSDGLTKTAFFHPYLFLRDSLDNYTKVRRMNTTFKSNAGLAVYNTNFMTKTLGNQAYTGIVELIVTAGIMTELREDMPSKTIPKNSFVVIGTGTDGATLKDLYKNGESLEFGGMPYQLTATPAPSPNTSTDPMFKNMRYCINGGSYLVKSGKAVTKFSHIPSTTSVTTIGPRTGLGISEDKKNIFIVTVDGCSEDSKGMTLQGFANYMEELGAYTAVNLDGGGSTSIASKIPGTSSFQMLGELTESGGRQVVNALGVVSSKSRDGVVIGTKINCPDSIFSGSSKGLTLQAWDNSVTSCPVNASSVKWSVNNSCGKIIKGVFYAENQGICTITADYKGIKSSAQISVLGNPVKLVFSTSLLKVSPDTVSTISVSAISSDGFSKKLSPASIKIKVNGNVGQMISPDQFLSGKNGAGFLSVTWRGLTASLPISVYSVVKKQVDSFNSNKYSLSKTDKQTTASIKVSDKLALTYQFPNTESTMRTISIKYKVPLKLPTKTYKLSFETSCDKANTNSVVVVIKDNKNKEYYLLASPGFDKAGKTTMSTLLPKLSAPASVTKIDFFEGACLGDGGTIRFDNLQALYKDYPSTKYLKRPKTSNYNDPSKAVFDKPADINTQTEYISLFGLKQNISSQNSAKSGFLSTARKASFIR